MEVSEPVNYSSGDHEYLVQKAAIKGVRSNPEQPFTYSSRDTPQEAIKYPHPKNRDGANTYAVQISEDVTPSESTTVAPSPFEDMSVRRGKSTALGLGKEQCFLKVFPCCILPERMSSLLFNSFLL